MVRVVRENACDWVSRENKDKWEKQHEKQHEASEAFDDGAGRANSAVVKADDEDESKGGSGSGTGTDTAKPRELSCTDSMAMRSGNPNSLIDKKVRVFDKDDIGRVGRVVGVQSAWSGSKSHQIKFDGEPELLRLQKATGTAGARFRVIIEDD